jgi:hypothetical protein
VTIKERLLLSAKIEHTDTTASCLQSFALLHSLLHPVLRRAPRAGTVGLRNPVSCDHVREKGDKVFRERSARLLAITDAHEEDVFPNEDFFPDIDNLFSDMSLTDDNTNGDSATASAPTPYVFLFIAFLFQIMFQFLSFLICLDILLFNLMLLAICLDLLPVYYLLRIMITLISIKLVMFYSLLLRIKSFGKLLIFPTP